MERYSTGPDIRQPLLHGHKAGSKRYQGDYKLAFELYLFSASGEYLELAPPLLSNFESDWIE